MQGKDKITGGLFGMAVGDALGRAVKGLKPETVRQCFGGMDVFADVRPFIGKGVKQYRMQGLYGTPTQIALAVLDATLANKNPDPAELGSLLTRLSAGGPEAYFGAYRHADGGFRKAVQAILDRPPGVPADGNLGGGACLTVAVPLALYHRKVGDALIGRCVASGLLLTQNVWEVLGTGVWGALLASTLEITQEEETAQNVVDVLLERAPQLVDCVSEWMCERIPALSGMYSGREGDILADSFTGLRSQMQRDWPSLCAWIVENAAPHFTTPISNPAQGTVLTLLPAALAAVEQGEAGFADGLRRVADLGKEAGRLGALAGSLAGVLHGFASIPSRFKSGLVNAKEIRMRAEALASRKPDRASKDLHAMELALTQKENEEGKRFAAKKAKKTGSKAAVSVPYWEEEPEEIAVPKKEDIAQWRQFQKDKTRKKRDRRRHLGKTQDPE